MALSVALTKNVVHRLDSTYFLHRDLELLQEATAGRYSPLGEVAYVTDGIHTSIPFREGSGIKVLSAKHPKDGYIDDSLFEEIDATAHALNPRTALREGDVLLSTVGTIGNAAVVTSDLLPANSDRHVAILRPLANASQPIAAEFLATTLLSDFGRMQTRRETTGNVQPNLFLDKIRTLLIPRFGEDFEASVTNLYRFSGAARTAAKRQLAEAEALLLDALGLRDWSPPEPLTYTRSSADVAAAGRLDAQYYQPAKAEMLARLAALDGTPLADSFDVIRDLVDPRRDPSAQCRNYDLTDALQPVLDAAKAPGTFADMDSQKVRFRDGDLAVARLRAYLREIAVVRVADEIPSVGSSEFYVLRRKPGAPELTAEALMVFLRSPPVQIILKWCQDGSQHPRFSERDLMAIPLPDCVVSMNDRLSRKVNEAQEQRRQSAALLSAAKRAVEIAIEDSEAAALAYIDGQRQAVDASAVT